jgi:hypothetical protein
MTKSLYMLATEADFNVSARLHNVLTNGYGEIEWKGAS